MLGIPLSQPWFSHSARRASESVVRAQQADRPARRISQLAARDHRDDGSAIAGLLIGLVVTLPVWALVIVLLVVLW